MPLIKKLCIFVILFLFSINSFSSTEYKSGTCSIETSFNHRISKTHSVRGLITVQMSKSNIVPMMTIELTRPVSGADIKLSWSEIDLIDRNDRPIFDSAYQQALQINAPHEISFFSENDQTFYAKNLNLQRIQNFFSLFLSQYSFNLHLNSDERWLSGTMPVPLTGSDLALRKLATECYSQRAKEYLQGINRIQGYASSWKNSYGIFEWDSIIEYSPQAYARSLEASVESISDLTNEHQKLSNLLSQLDQRVLLIKTRDALKQDQNYSDFFVAENNTFELYSQSRSRLNELRGHGSQVEQTEEKIKNQRQEIREISANLKEITRQRDQLDSYTTAKVEETDFYLNAIQSLIEQVILVDVGQARVATEIEQVNTILTQLNNLEAQLEWEFERMSNQVAIITFTSILELQESNGHVFSLFERQKNIQNFLSTISLITSELKRVLESQQPVLALYQQNLETNRALADLSAQHDQLQALLNQSNRKRDGLSLESLSSLLANETNHGPWSREELDSEVKKTIRAAYKDFDEKVEILLQENPQALLPQIICKSNSLKTSYTGQCLTIIEMSDSLIVSDFFKSLSSDILHKLVESSSQSLAPYFSSTTTPTTVSKAESLAQELSLEHLIISEELTQSWNQVLLSRWKYRKFSQFQTSQEQYSQTDFETALNNEIQATNEIKVQMDSITVDYTIQNSTLQSLEAEYLQADAQYFSNLRKVRTRILTIVELDQLEATNPAVSCLITNDQSLPCIGLFQELDNSLNHDLIAVSQNLESSASLLFQQSLIKLSKLLATRQDLLTQQHTLTEQLQTTESALVATGLQPEVETLLSHLKAENELQTRTIEGLAQAEKQLERSRGELVSLQGEKHFQVRTIMNIAEEVYSQKNRIESFCLNEQRVLDLISTVEENINNIFSKNMFGQNSPDLTSNICKIF